MDYGFDFKRKDKSKRNRIIFVIIVCILAIIISSFFARKSSNKVISNIASIIVKPFDIIFESSSNFFKSTKEYFANNKRVSEEKEELEEKYKNLQYQLLEYQNLTQENESLKEMVNIKKQFQHFDIKLGKIEYREHDNWTQTFRVNLGKDDGVKKGQAVVHEEGLVGYVSEVLDQSSTVTTILDPSASVSVNISTINEPAILKGDLDLKLKNKLKLVFIPIDAEISVSDMLYTSGLGSTYPNAIPVGKITEVINDKNNTERYAIVEPNVTIRTISEVGIIIN